jgi:hypothetical protein
MRTTPINDTYCTLVSRGISGNSELSPRRMVVVQATGMKPTTQRKAQSLSPSRSSAPTAVSKFAAAGNSLTTAAEQFCMQCKPQCFHNDAFFAPGWSYNCMPAGPCQECTRHKLCFRPAESVMLTWFATRHLLDTAASLRACKALNNDDPEQRVTCSHCFA